MELAVAYVHTRDVGGAVLEEAIGEAARGGADVQGIKARDGNGVGVEEALEFLAAAGDEAGRGDDGDGGVGGEFFAWLVEDGGIVADFAREDEGFGLGSGFGQATGDQQLIQADFGGRRHWRN